MLAHRRADVHDLNHAARVFMLRAGKLGPDAIRLGERDFRVGDRAVCRRNDTLLGVRNGMRATVSALEPETGTITLRRRDGAVRRIPAAYARDHLEHAYALTGHAAQGATVDRAFVLLRDEGALREWGYVACSRARIETRLYVTGDGPERDRRHVDARRLAGALVRPASEQPAAAQARGEAGSAIGRAREQRAADLATAEGRLAAAERELRSSGRFGRRGRRYELAAEVALRRAAVRLARRQLDELPAVVRDPRPVRTPIIRAELAQGRSPARVLERDSLDLGL
jgi:hypothetical protein